MLILTFWDSNFNLIPPIYICACMCVCVCTHVFLSVCVHMGVGMDSHMFCLDLYIFMHVGVLGDICLSVGM